ncbi:MAG: UvrD-helicase domain-containing protein [Bacteroidales bacterium]|nr:UvrD-helicase domain-containing protein [Bacteroidales bacterium]
MIKILKASAGSGKTFNLAKTYIRLLLQNEDPTAYRHILAVTFTNKATDEMKSRILKELHKLSTDPSKSQYTKDFVPGMFKSENELRMKAENVLYNILHDYSAFAISTIDRFFQQTLKAFSREIGQFASYQVELDKNSLVKESVDRVLDSLTEDDKSLLGWLSDSMMEQLEQGKRFNLEGSLSEMAQRLKSDEHRSVVEENGIDDEAAYSKKNLSRMKVRFREVTAAYVDEVKAAAEAVEEAFGQAGVSPSETSRSFMAGPLAKFAAMDSRSQLPELTPAFRTKAGDFSTWFKKADQVKYKDLEGSLVPPVARLVKVYDDGLKTFNTAKILLGQANDLGIASELNREFRNLMKEKNVLSIDDSNLILKGIIDGSDAPFIYEKLGVRYEHFLLDEFQDTSRVQWENFKPLISNSDAGNFENLLVGDVKQSIYRWRGSDWKLMAREVGEEFPGAVGDSLKGNWRSLRNIVGFNNDFFRHASMELDRIYGSGETISVASIYTDEDSQGQEVMTDDPAEGFIEAVFCDKDSQPQHILETILKVLEAGARPGDITVLVRRNSEGSGIASFLMENGIDVISDDSLHLKASFIVRKLVSLISSVRNPEDTIGSYLATQAGLDIGKLSYHSLMDLCEQLLRLMREKDDEEIIDGEALYIQSFMDYVQDHVASNGNSLDAFLKAWDEADPMVSSPSDVNAVRVMTVHKAKGLEFPYVIFPYSEKVGLFKPQSSWTVPKVEGTPLADIGKAAFDVPLSSSSAETLFEEEYRRELLLQYIDNINTYYVALTRASKGMTIISDIAVKAHDNFAGILLGYLEGRGTEMGFEKDSDDSERIVIFRKGTMYDFSKLERKDEDIVRREPGFPSYPLNPESDTEETVERGRLRVSADSVDFFTEEGMARNEARHNGTVLHDILSRIIIPSDLDSSVLHAVQDGDLESGRSKEVEKLLSERIASKPEWFPQSGATILNETALFDSDGREWRPDRVIVKDGKVTIVDFKFGEYNPAYRSQVARYASIYRSLGYQDVSTAIWYVVTDEVD